MPQVVETMRVELTPDQWAAILVSSVVSLCHEEGTSRYSAASAALIKCENKRAEETGKALAELMKAIRAHATELLKNLVRHVPRPWQRMDEGDGESVTEALKALGIVEGKASALPGEIPWAWDEELASYVEKLGESGKDLAEDIRAESSEMKAAGKVRTAQARWVVTLGDFVSEHGAFFAVPRHAELASVLWLDVVKPQLERERSKPPALPRQVHAPVAMILSGPKVREEGGQKTLDLGLPQPCVIRQIAELPNAERGVPFFQSIHAHRVLWQIVFDAHPRAIMNPGMSPVLEYDGGYTELAKRSGIESADGVAKVRALVELFSVLDLTFPGYRGGLLTRSFTEAKGRRRAMLRITPGDPLLPGYVFKLQEEEGTASLTARRNQDLIPLLPIPPIFGGRPNDAGPQATLQLRVVAHLRDNARDLVEGRGAALPIETWVRLAEASNVSKSLAPKVLSHWLEDHDDGPAVLKEVSPDRYTLGDAHAAARAFLEKSGRASLEASEAGRRSMAKREAARRRMGQK